MDKIRLQELEAKADGVTSEDGAPLGAAVTELIAEVRRLREALELAEEGLRLNGALGYAQAAREALNA